MADYVTDYTTDNNKPPARIYLHSNEIWDDPRADYEEQSDVCCEAYIRIFSYVKELVTKIRDLGSLDAYADENEHGLYQILAAIEFLEIHLPVDEVPNRPKMIDELIETSKKQIRAVWSAA